MSVCTVLAFGFLFAVRTAKSTVVKTQSRSSKEAMRGVTLEEEARKFRLLASKRRTQKGNRQKNRRDKNTRKRNRGNGRREKRGATILKS